MMATSCGVMGVVPMLLLSLHGPTLLLLMIKIRTQLMRV
jgi:hypothetical protein